MSDVIFVKTRYQDIGYASYLDYWNLVEFAGYPVIYVDEIPQYDGKDKTFIICPVNAEWNTWAKGAVEGRIILYQLEWNIDGEHHTPACVSEVWNADKRHAEKNGWKYVPMGSDSRLCIAGNNVLKEWDVAQISYQTPRRMIVTEQMEARGLKVAQNERLWGAPRSMVLNASEIMCHVHQTEGGKGIAPLRWCLAAAHHLPVISESVPDAGIFGHSHMMQADYQWLPEFVQMKLRDKRMLANYAHALNQLLCVDYSFSRMVESHV